jgi:predicted metal-dependent peptidase
VNPIAEVPVALLERADRAVRGSLLRLRSKSPFFATLALFAPFRPDPFHPTAATDGREVIYNPAFIAALPASQVDGVMLHEVLHAALLHVTRRGTRDAKLWNIAADYVVNGVLFANGFDLPEGVLRDPTLENYSVEEVYAILERRGGQNAPELSNPDLLEPNAPEEGDTDGTPARGLRPGEIKELERFWRDAVQQATSAARGLGQGKTPAGLERVLGELVAERLDWRTLLWRFLTRTPTDFAAFDRRFIHARQYIETLESESVKVFVCVDTSGSVEDAQMQQLLAEVRAIARAYPHAQTRLYYADAAVYGPFTLEQPGKPVGGGGTDFRPFFETIQTQDLENAVAVYLTDGYGDFPLEAPNLPVLWIVTPGGLEDFPFGEVVRLVD